MGSFPGLPPLELDPLPSLFPFSPCNVSYKWVDLKNINSDFTELTLNLILLISFYFRPPHDMADVLLSLKHAVLKPSPEPQSQHHHHHNSSQGYHHPSNPQQAQLSYTVHPQMLVSSPPNHHHHLHQNHHHHHQYQNMAANVNGFYDNSCSVHNSTSSASSSANALTYPSMSVNVSMNMTMHGYGSSSDPMQCSQVINKIQSI